MSRIPRPDRIVGGSIIKGEGYTPSQDGAIICLNGGDDLRPVLDRIEGAGGSVVMAKPLITEEIG